MELYQIKTEHPVVGYCESRIGGRSENQDSYGYHDTPFGLLIVVCDGMGGGPAGKTASSLAVSEILAGVMECEHDTAPKDVLEKAIQRANLGLLDAIAENPELSGMGTTCTALLLNEQSAIMAHVGDSRIYQLRHHGKVFRTFDHSLVFDLVKQKVITEEQARLSDQSNIITRALGMKQELEIDIEERPYKKGDRFLLCTDGIHGTMPEKELLALATQRGELGNVVDGIAAMVDGNGKKNGGGHDNLTLVIVETKEKSKLKDKMKNKATLILGLIAAALAIVCLLLNSCQNEDIDVDNFIIESEIVKPGVDTVRIEGSYDFFKDAEVMKINIGRDSTFNDASSHAAILTGRDYSVTVRNLQSATTYYYRYSVNIGLPRDFLTPTKHFTTLALPPTQHYTVSAYSQPAEGGTVTGGGTYESGQQCLLTATPNEGYDFVNWTENDSILSTDSLYRIMVYRDYTLTAHFEAQTPPVPDEYTVSVSANPTEGGTVSGGGNFQVGQSCTVRATANEGYSFLNWTENGNVVSTNATYTFAVAGNRTLVANFMLQAPQEYTISVSALPVLGGLALGGGTYQQGQSCTVTATANSGYSFTNWTENGNVVSTNASYTFTVTSNRTLVANFTAHPTNYTISVSANPNNGGTVSGGGAYQQGQNCTVIATAADGYCFSNWTENGNVVSSNANYSFTVNSNRSLVAHFEAQSYTISVSANPNNGGSVTGGGTYNYGQNCTVTATANSGYSFTNWTENGNVVSTNASYTFTVTSNRTLVANFTAQPQNYTITVIANPSNGGTVTGGGTYQQGQSCTVTASANSGFSFTNWTENGSVVSTNASYSFTVNGNRYLVASFEQNSPSWPNGVLPGVFSASATKQVKFSQGNLQYQASSNTWRFSDTQHQYCGTSNNNVSPTYSGWIDLFGWGTSGWISGAECYQPWSISENSSSYWPGGDPSSDLTGNYANADWGVYNSISNGGSNANEWRLLTHEEWLYILLNRPDAAEKMSLGTVCNIHGLIILPDDFTIPQGISFIGSSDNWNVNNYDESTWIVLQELGAVFLPACGMRQGASYGNSNIGVTYWSSTHSDGTYAYGIWIRSSNLYPHNHDVRWQGNAVRLVKDL